MERAARPGAARFVLARGTGDACAAQTRSTHDAASAEPVDSGLVVRFTTGGRQRLGVAAAEVSYHRRLDRRMIPPPLVSFVVAAATPVCAPAPVRAQDPLPVVVHATASTVTDDGTFTLRLSCTPARGLSRRYDLRVALTSATGDLVVADHALEPRPDRWRAGERVECELQLELPFDAELELGEFVSVRIGFATPGSGIVRPLGGEWAELVEEDGLVDVLAVTVPTFAGARGRERLEAVLAEADSVLRAGDVAGAWRRLEAAVREAADDATKRRLRDALAKVGRRPPAPPTALERGIVDGRVRSEKARVFRQEAGRMFDRGELHGALRLLEQTGGELAVAGDEGVIGALGDAERVMQRADDIRDRLLAEVSGDEAAEVEALLGRHGRTAKLVAAADQLAEKERYPLALALYRELRRVDGEELYDRARARLEEVGERYLASTPPDEERKVRAILEHPAWARTEIALGHCFIYIGPRELVQGLPAESKLRFDLAYVFITDLFGRVPNPEGDRITVYFKELLDFGGGLGGGKTIDIGRASPAPERPVRVDNGLLYHELTHCVDDTSPVHGGFHEGLANLGAAYAHEALEQKGDALHSFDANLAAFRRYFLERDLEYWRIQNYGPSAGLFLHFVDTYAGLRGGGHDWSPLRRFFREYRDAPVRDGREPSVMRAVGRYLVRAFGPKAFDDLVEFGFPLVESDRDLLARELDAFDGGAEAEEFAGLFAECPNSPLPRDALERELSKAGRRASSERSAAARAELGVVSEWKVIGPFFAQRADPGAFVFPPELSIDFSEKPASWRSSRAEWTQRTWQDPIPSARPRPRHKNVELSPTGWLRFDYEPYGDDNSAIYALTHVTVPTATEAVVHVRADDDFVLFVNDRRIGSYRGRGKNGSTPITWRGPYEHAPDAMRFPVRLAPGRNRVLVKIRNRAGTAGLVLALARPDGSRLEFTADADPPEVPGPRSPVAEPRWKRIATLDHRSFKRRSKAAVGSFRSAKKAFYGRDTDGAVGWRLFTVRPGFPKDSPSNLLWLEPSLTADLDALRLDVTLASRAAPKLLITFQGEGGQDGLSGWNLILVPRGGAVEARLERYDRLVYHTDPVPLPAAGEVRVLSLRYWEGWCSVSIDGTVLFDRVSIDPIPGRHRIGVATWGPEPRLQALELSRGL